MRRAALAALVLLAACSSGDDGPTEAAPTTASTTATTVATTTTAAPAPTFATAAADEPVALAEQIVATERAVRDPATEPAVLVAAAQLQQLAYRRLGDHPEWDATVLASAPPELHEVVTRNAAARRGLTAIPVELQDTLPAWRVQAPPPVAELRAHYDEAEAAFGVPWHVLAAINMVETGFGRIVGLSTAGAQGPMQFLPATWEAYGMGGDVWDPRDAVLGAANYLAANGGAGEDLDNALYRYNRHDGYVAAIKEYSALLAADPQVLRGYHAWRVIYRTRSHGEIVLPEGYESTERLPVEEWLASQ